ncbi:MAG TPA: Mur ligase family protein [Thermomicrobiales bacterium]|nr:Mur ligase family protein [Thermomicrobiales bacterium]
MTSTIERYHESAARLDALIEATPEPTDTTREAVQRRAEFRMDRLRRFLAQLGDPHLGYPIVHIGGTSGKGSTSTMIAAILRAAGYRTGLHTSPYLQTPGEKLQLDGLLIDPEQFSLLVDVIMTAHDRWLAGGEASLTYGEAWFALTALFFSRNAVDVAVLEVGAGGRFDLTNVITPAMSVITSVGIDHTNTLGDTIEDIAWHKAGVIKPGIPAVSAVTNPAAREIIREEARTTKSPLTVIDLDAELYGVQTGRDGTTWIGAVGRTRFHTAMCGRFQAVNGATAIVASRLLHQVGLSIADKAIHDGLGSARIPGRAEIIDDPVPVLLDGAHNADKVAALTADIPTLLPMPVNGRRFAVLGVLEAKQAAEMIQRLVPVMDVLIATAPKVRAKQPKEAAQIAEIARRAGFAGTVKVERSAETAIRQAQAMAQAERGDTIVVTGSLYLIGNVRGQWFREEDIVLQQTPWPEPTTARTHRTSPQALATELS